MEIGYTQECEDIPKMGEAETRMVFKVLGEYLG
jgi:hypothetical protein